MLAEFPVEQVLKVAGVVEIDKFVLAGGLTCIPKVQHFLKQHFGATEPSKGINSDRPRAVAYGATVQDGILPGEQGTADGVLMSTHLRSV